MERVVAEIRALQAQGELGSTGTLERTGHGDLVRAARIHAGSWAKAMVLAGVGYVPRRSRTDKSVLQEIRRLHRAGKSLQEPQVEAALVLAARRRFGSWRKARAAAVPLPLGNEDWTEQKVRDELAALHARGVSLSALHIKRMGLYRLVSAAIRLFGSWDAAREQAVDGFEPLLRYWSKKRVVSAIRERHARQRSLSATRVAAEDSRLLAAATRYFGSWPAARAAARVPYRDPRHTWPAERVIAELRRRSPKGVRPWTTDIPQALYRVAIARFGSFEEACKAAGLRPRTGAARRQVPAVR